jgi:adenylate kinase family enzyme
MKYRRIAVWGNSGAGKSTFSVQLAAATQLPVYHVDHITWMSGWRYRSEGEVSALQDAWLQQPEWIIDGVGPMSSLKSRFKAAALIVHFKADPSVCLTRAQRRMDADALRPDEFIADGCRYSDVADLQRTVIEAFHQEVQPAIEKMLASEFSHKPQLVLNASCSSRDLIAEVLDA